MSCRFCSSAATDALYCSKCGSPFYLLVHELVTYYAYDKVWLALNVTNRGKSDLTIESVTIGDCVLTPIRVPVIISAGGETVTYTFSGEWFRGAPAAALPVEATGRVATRQRVLRTLPGHIDVQQVPSLDLALVGIPSGDAVEVGPSAGYGVTLGCRSAEGGTGAIEKLRVTIFRGGTQNEIASTDVVQSPAVSIGSGKSEEIPVLLPHHSTAGELLKGTHYCEIAPILRDGGLDLLNGKLMEKARTACSFQVTYRERAEVTVGVGRPTDAGYGVVAFVREDLTSRYEDLVDSRSVAGTILQNDPLVDQTFKDLAQRVFSWRVPIGEERIKELFLLPLTRAGAAAEVESHLTATVRFAGNADDVAEIRMRQAPGPDEPEPAWQPWSQEIRFDRFRVARQLQVYVVVHRPGRHEITLQIRVHDASSVTGWEPIDYRVTIHAFEPALYRQVVGLDFGTSNSCVALDAGEFRADGKWILSGMPRCLPLNVFDRHGSLDPSVVPSLLGYRRRIEDGDVVPFLPDPRYLPHHTCVEFKIALQDPKLFEHQEFRVDSLRQTIDYLKLLIVRAREHLEERGIRESRLAQTLVVTLPTTFIEIGRERILEAVRAAVPGLAPGALLPCDESIAALLFARTKETDLFANQRFIVVYDFGGGTTDVTSLWVDASANLFEIGIGGSSNVGGTIIDCWILQRLSQKAVPPEDQPELSRKAVHAIPELSGSGAARVSLENLKKQLGEFGPLSEGIRKVSKSYSVDKSWLAVKGDALGPLLVAPLQDALEKKFVAILEDVLTRSLSYNDLRETRDVSFLVILAGNGSRLTHLPESIKEILEKGLQQRSLSGTVEVRTLNRPKEAVALGAASYNGLLVPERRADRVRFFVQLDAQPVCVATDLEPIRRVTPSELGLLPNRVPLNFNMEARKGIDAHPLDLVSVANHPGNRARIQWLDFDVRGEVEISAGPETIGNVRN